MRKDTKITGREVAALTNPRPITNSSVSEPVVDPGYCQCGCGEWVGYWKKTKTGFGQVKGKPKRFVRGHNRTLERKLRPDYAVEDRGFDTPCWVWLKSVLASGHGQINVDGEIVLAHRHCYEQEKGPIPEGVQLLQLCRVHACINPDHMEAVAHKERVRCGASTKLDKALVEKIRQEARDTGYYEKLRIAQEYGISLPHLYGILQGASWAD
jgi:hypothetical protein